MRKWGLVICRAATRSAVIKAAGGDPINIPTEWGLLSHFVLHSSCWNIISKDPLNRKEFSPCFFFFFIKNTITHNSLKNKSSSLQIHTPLSITGKKKIRNEIPYWYFHWLSAKVTRWLEGFWPAGKPVGGDGSEGTHAHECIGGQSTQILPNIIQLGNPQLSQDFLSLHGCCALTLQENTEGRIQLGNVKSWFCTNSPDWNRNCIVVYSGNPFGSISCHLKHFLSSQKETMSLVKYYDCTTGYGDTVECSILSFYEWLYCFRSLHNKRE